MEYNLTAVVFDLLPSRKLIFLFNEIQVITNWRQGYSLKVNGLLTSRRFKNKC